MIHGCLIIYYSAQIKISCPYKIEESFFFFFGSLHDIVSQAKVHREVIKSNLKAETLIKTSCIYADSDQSREHEASTALSLSLNSGDRRAAEGMRSGSANSFFS